MKNKIPLVSIGIPVYNGEEFLRQTLDSLLSQSYKNLELIISDNTSVDGTRKICEEYIAKEKDKRIRYIRQKENLGGPNNFEFVLKEARGKYFMWASDDDVWDSRFIEKCIKRFDADIGAIMVFSNFVKINEFGDAIEVYTPERFFPFEKDIYQRLKRYILFYGSDGKANLVHGLWIYKELIRIPIFTFSWGSDMNFVFRALGRGRFSLVNKALFSKRVDSRLSQLKIPFPFKIFRAIFNRMKILFSLHFYTYIVDILLIKQLRFIDKLRLILYTFLVMSRLFFSHKI